MIILVTIFNRNSIRNPFESNDIGRFVIKLNTRIILESYKQVLLVARY